MIKESIQEFRLKRQRDKKRLQASSKTKERLGLAERRVAETSFEMKSAATRTKEAADKYDPAKSIAGWMDEYDALRIERADSEVSTTQALTADPRPRGRDSSVRLAAKQGLIDRGIPEHIAEGFMMNFADESGFQIDINEADPLVEGSRGGKGIYQLTGSRRVAFEEAYGGDWSLDNQLDFLVSELEGSERSAFAKISETTTAGEAGAAIVKHFLRPAAEHRASRSARYLGQ